MNENVTAIANRVRRIREIVAGKAQGAQADLCRRLGIAPNRWNQYETGARTITRPVAKRLKEEYGIPYDFIYEGDPSGLPKRIADNLFEDAAE